MKKSVFPLIGSVLVGVLLLGNNVTAAEKPMKLHIASWNVPADPTTKVLEAIAADLKAATGGKVTI